MFKFIILALFVSSSTFAAEFICKISLGKYVTQGATRQVQAGFDLKAGFVAEILNDQRDVIGYVNLENLQRYRTNGKLNATIAPKFRDQELENLLTVESVKLFGSETQAAMYDGRANVDVAVYAVEDELHILYPNGDAREEKFKKPVSHVATKAFLTKNGKECFPVSFAHHPDARLEQLTAAAAGSEVRIVSTLVKEKNRIITARTIETLTFDESISALAWLQNRENPTLVIVSGNQISIHEFGLGKDVRKVQKFSYKHRITNVFIADPEILRNEILFSTGSEIILMGKSRINPIAALMGKDSGERTFKELNKISTDVPITQLRRFGRNSFDVFTQDKKEAQITFSLTEGPSFRIQDPSDQGISLQGESLF